jgi:hypothetical protein
MRRTVALAALLTLAALAPPAATAASTQVLVDASGAGAAPLDLVDDAGGSVLFRLNPANFSAAAGPVRSAYVRLTHSGEPAMDLALMPAADGNLTYALPINTPDLVAGAWQATFVGLRTAGPATLGNRSLDVTARDSAPPQLALAHPASPVVVGAGGTVDLTVRDPLLRQVTFSFAGLRPTPLPSPYAFPGDSLPEGSTEVTFAASDRAGHVTTLRTDVVRDTVSPMVNLTLPEHVYAGVPFSAFARVVETGPYTLRLTVNGTAQPDVQVTGSVPAGTNRSTAFPVTPNATGDLALSLEVVDQVGARTFATRKVTVETPITDLRLSRLGVQPSGVQFAQRPVTFTATLEQAEGVTTLAVPVTLAIGGQSLARVESVPAAGPRLLTWEVHLPGGRYTATASATVPEGANETAPGDEEATFDLEVFLGRVLDNGTAYDIRAGATGLPSAAVVEGQSTSYPLKVVDKGTGVAYRFTASGDRTVDWDPLDPLGEQAAAASLTSSSSSATGSVTKGSKDSPAAGPLVLVALVALAALVQRRRL